MTFEYRGMVTAFAILAMFIKKHASLILKTHFVDRRKEILQRVVKEGASSNLVIPPQEQFSNFLFSDICVHVQTLPKNLFIHVQIIYLVRCLHSPQSQTAAPHHHLTFRSLK